MAYKKHRYTEDSKYEDGYGVDKRKEAVIDKRKERRFERALRTKNYEELTEDESDFDDLDPYAEGDYQ